MKKTLNFTKVGDTGKQRFYKLSIPVTKVAHPRYDWEEERKNIYDRLSDEYKHFLPEMIEYVCVSDANTHIERLLFVAIPLNEEKTKFGCMALKQIDGRHTFMIHGGNIRDVHPDGVYLRRLASANGYNYSMV